MHTLYQAAFLAAMTKSVDLQRRQEKAHDKLMAALAARISATGARFGLAI
jgi:hypothetical protein